MSYNQSRYQKTLSKLVPKPEEFRQVCGVLPQTFQAMVSCVTSHKYRGQKTGRLGNLCFEDQVFVMLEYYRDYPSMTKLGMEYEVNPTTIGRLINRVEKILVASSEFRLPSKRELQKGNLSIEAVIVDATEMQVQKPKRRKFKLKKSQKSAQSTKEILE
jgi:predicted DNA-binding protein YlxM (UPF0122 family)